ncbi:glycoside hydrolase [Thozetella sp. PMI_491]|nr:glycoside hydrolase [Thozetella sp. PMI_491]
MASLPHHRGSGGYGYGFYLLLFLVAILSQPTWSQSTPQDPDYTCAADRPCAVGCCGKFGICGMGPDFCAPENCVNSCDAKSECDPAGWGPQYAKSEGCPLNVCCSKFGFCGTSTEFCGNEVIQNPSCPGGTSASKRTVGYYESWAGGRPCDAVEPETIHFAAYTHINFAFASVDPTTFTVVPSDPGDLDLYSRLTALKAYAPGLQVWLSIGGWTMNDPDQPTATTFSDVAGSPDAQAAFTNSLIRIMSTYGFDGVDIDWEYPVAPERSGRPEDYANYPNWLTNLRGAFAAAGHNYGLSITLPSSFWYLQNFDIVKLEKVVDWFNMMEYDLHGTWDSTDVWIGAFVNAHTNLTEIDQSLKLMWRNNIDPSKVVMGLGFYGRSFALSDPSCTAPGCPFSGAAPAGPCTGSPGTLSFAEIETLIGQGATVTLDTEAAVKIVTWDGNWVSYDDATTLQAKIDYANDNCLGGTMVWAASLDDSPQGFGLPVDRLWIDELPGGFVRARQCPNCPGRHPGMFPEREKDTLLSEPARLRS